MGSAKKTTDHETIRAWVEERGGHPAHVIGTGNGDPGVLRIDFPDYGEDENLEEIEWNKFFEKFDSENLAFLYQEETDEGGPSRFNKLVRRDSK